MTYRFLKAILVSTVFALLASGPLKGQSEVLPWLEYRNSPAVDSLMRSMTIKDMVAQSFWIPA